MSTIYEKFGIVTDVFRVIDEERPAFRIFLAVNLFFGGMALWLPSVVASQHPTAEPLNEFLKAFEQGNGYLYGLALLAAASSYWMREYLEEKQTDFKQLKVYATGSSLILMIFLSILLAILIYKGFTPPSPNALPQIFPLITQVGCTFFAVVMATYLFCLERIDNYPDFGKNLKDKKTEENIKKMEQQSKTGLET